MFFLSIYFFFQKGLCYPNSTLRLSTNQIAYIDTFFRLTSMGDLILSQANESHEGSYLCQAKNGIGSSGKSKLITIKVDGKDIILTYTYKTNLLNKEK